MMTKELVKMSLQDTTCLYLNKHLEYYYILKYIGILFHLDIRVMYT